MISFIKIQTEEIAVTIYFIFIILILIFGVNLVLVKSDEVTGLGGGTSFSDEGIMVPAWIYLLFNRTLTRIVV